MEGQGGGGQGTEGGIIERSRRRKSRYKPGHQVYMHRAYAEHPNHSCCGTTMILSRSTLFIALLSQEKYHIRSVWIWL